MGMFYQDPWFGNYCIMLACTDVEDGSHYFHPVRWQYTIDASFNRLYDDLLKDYYRGRLAEPPVIVDYTGMRRQKLPAAYNKIVVEGDLSTLL